MNIPHDDVVAASSETKKNNTICNHDLMLEILSRLPARSLVRFRCVKKQWNSLFRDPYFVTLQLKHAAKNRTTYFCHHWFLESSQIRVYPFKVEAGELKIPYSKFTMPVSTSPQFILSNACNGLITFYYAGLAYVVNPSTREWTSIPKMTPSGMRSPQTGNPSVGFGFSESTGKYKLVNFYYQRKRWGLEVLTLGVDRSWRSLGDAPCGSITEFPPTYLNGFIHWMVDDAKETMDSSSILSFDVSHEKFSTTMIQLPRLHPDPCAVYRHLFTSDFEGSLSLIDWRMYFDGVLLHPVMDVHTQTQDSAWKESWRMRLSELIPYDYKCIVYSLQSNSMFPVSVQDGKVIIHHPQKNWKLQDLHTGDSSELILPEFDGYERHPRLRAKPFACAETIVPIDWLVSPNDAD